MRAGHPGCDFKYLLKTLSNPISPLSRLLTVQIHSCLCPRPFISQSVSLSVQVSFCYQFHQPFFPSHPSVVSHPARLCLLWCTFLLPFLCFFSHALPPSLLVFVPISFMSPFLFPLSSVLCLPRSSHLPPILLLPASLSPSLLLSPKPPLLLLFTSSSLLLPSLKCITVI